MKSQEGLCSVCKRQSSLSQIRSFNNYTLQECSLCKVQFWIPFLNPGVDWYEQGNRYVTGGVLKPEVSRVYHKRFLAEQEQKLRGKKVLDVGCGTGEFLAATQEKGAEPWGVDFDESAIRAAQKHFGLQHVYAMPLEEFLKKEGIPEFDIITCFEVIEHVDDPRALLKLLHSKLQPQELLFLSTPSRDRVLPDLNSWDFPPNHLSRWNAESLQNILELEGFEVAELSYGEGWRFLLEGVNSKFRFGLTKKIPNSKRAAEQAMNTVVVLGKMKEHLIGSIPATILWIWGLITNRKGGTMLVVCRKK